MATSGPKTSSSMKTEPQRQPALARRPRALTPPTRTAQPPPMPRLNSWSPAYPKAHGQTSMGRSEEHTSELQSLMRISYAVFCLKKQNKKQKPNTHSTLRVFHTTTHNTKKN